MFYSTLHFYATRKGGALVREGGDNDEVEVELPAIGNYISHPQILNLIFNIRLPSSGQVTLPAAFVEKPRAKRQKQASPLHAEPDTFCSPDPASPTLLLDLPNELLHVILGNLTDSDLLSPALLFNRRLRANAARTYLARANIIGNNNGYIYIKDIVGCMAIILLSTMPLFDKISLTCDLFYVVEYGRHLRKLIAATPQVRHMLQSSASEIKVILHPSNLFPHYPTSSSYAACPSASHSGFAEGYQFIGSIC
ncbi:uncharacterized protein LACBIDRAFT_327691 [Laccaria bicolor S238N-H82]|uniref:Predicted protein n=1 Tax=Laccaria bicolor (strain S238N-H82 / ATCC MYA-4686) TaxID=486041 RepID=B0DCJ2_LACBS|nr:uncharacterized protein LACBIDRAFT_327691 [Laccaria bicolor S238N-H82]EDR07909.1 predicted protein [Laccaria bicolor S238N-H82]|eukprot:XP_001881698.1 predicted protein [Laccaria bicolor S238N-H82]